MRRHIIVTAYNISWNARVKTEAETVRGILGQNCLCIHHVGSTAVPGLSAKPTIDLLPVVRNLASVDAVATRFTEAGYEYLGEYGIPQRRYLRKVEGENDLFHLHVFAESSAAEIERHLTVRDYLRTHADAAAAYGALKTELAKRFPYDNDAYCDEKDAFVKRLEKTALDWAARQKKERLQMNEDTAYVIRKARRADEAALLALSRQVLDTNFKAFMGSETVDAFIASGMADAEISANMQSMHVLVKGEALAGLCIRKENLLHLFMIAPEFQGSGAAAFFERKMCQSLFKTYPRLLLECFAANERAVQFYLRQGWTICKKTVDADTGLARLFLEKTR